MRYAPTLALLAVLALAGCTGSAPPVTASTQAAPQEAQVRVGDVVVHASVVPTSTLPDAAAKEYGLERGDGLAMLMVSARSPDGGPAPAGVTITATAGPVNGVPEPVTLREVRSGDLVDRVGTVPIAPPETLRFDVVVNYGSATSTLQFTRDFFPR